MHSSVLTLADIWPERPTAMIVGLNPAPKSVTAGHYYQGAVGRRQMTRLVDAGLFPRTSDAPFFEADALAGGAGFTDLVKGPTVGENDVPVEEQRHGRSALIAELSRRRVSLVICIFRHPADAILGEKSVVGFQQHATAWGGHLFGLPGPFESAERSVAHMNTLRDFLLRA